MTQTTDIVAAALPSERPSVWARFDPVHAAGEKSPAGARPAAAAGSRRRFRWVLDAILPLALILAAGAAVLLPEGLTGPARLALFTFAAAAVLWATTSLNAAYVALAAVVVLVLARGSPQERLFDALASDVIWLMIGAFVLGGAVQKTGLAERLTRLVVGRAKSVRGVFWLLTAVLVPLTFFIPSTSGRAAVALPLFNSIAGAANDRKIARALALLIPSVILVATICTLIGAGSHLIANDLLRQVAGTDVSFTRWIVLGAPFGIASSAAACWVVLWLFLDRDQQRRALRLPAARPKPFSRPEWVTLAVIVAMVGLWVTEARHGVEIATVTVAGALVLTAPGVGVLSWKEGLKSVSWNLIVFVGAALVLGKALIETGAAQWIIERVFAVSGLSGAESRIAVLVGLAFLALTSHVYMTSHSARAAALVPPLLYLAGSLQIDAVAVMFIGTVGMDYCLTFPVSSKALLMFQETDQETFRPADLLKLSAVLMPIHLLLMIGFYYTYWRWVGLRL